ncbi:hypothetical protein IGI04_023060 [Brassica rapa subsp. trilocularis]|uniref:Uncharacterized protein n=1 Tax=Brassica rapa subsp. trilocularis TaxID=1813537 RepID=A0ABQ7M2S0_BRACM|nr:hypothetical protein IGI04_023060 [Brassica rapa subsp. trilocularis]
MESEMTHNRGVGVGALQRCEPSIFHPGKLLGLMERELIIRDAMSVIACEGPERFARPETYKQWQGWKGRVLYALPCWKPAKKQ